MSKDNQFQVLYSGQNRALFLDRDGVINVDYGYVCHPENFEFIEGIFEVARKAHTLIINLLLLLINLELVVVFFQSNSFLV